MKIDEEGMCMYVFGMRGVKCGVQTHTHTHHVIVHTLSYICMIINMYVRMLLVACVATTTAAAL